MKKEKKVLARLVATNNKITPEKQVPGFILGWRATRDETGHLKKVLVCGRD